MKTTKPHGRAVLITILIGVASMVVACGGDDDGSASSTQGSSTGGAGAGGSGGGSGGAGVGGAGTAGGGGSAPCTCRGPSAPMACPTDMGACGDLVEGQTCCDARDVLRECNCNDLACFLDEKICN